MDHHIAQAREFPPRLRRFRTGKDRALSQAQDREPDEGRRHRAQSRKIEGAVGSARAWLDIMEKGPGFSNLLWDFLDGKPKQNHFRTTKLVPAETEISRKMSKELIGAASNSSGPTIVYAFMQAVGMVNDHLVSATAIRPSPSSQTEMSKAPKKGAPRAWQRMLSGRRLDLLDPSPLDVEVEDIAHGLARVARAGTGKPRVRISFRWRSTASGRGVGARQDTTSRCGGTARGAAARRPEYVIGDMISPFKAVIGDSYKAVEKRLLAAIHLRFGLPPKLPDRLTDLIKAADRAAAFLEATRLAGFADEEARRFFGPPPKFSAAIERDYLTPWPAGIAETRFRERLENLMRAS